MEDQLKTSFTILLKQELHLMYRVSFRLTKDRDAAEDLVADTCVRAWEKFATLKNQQSFRPWILRICQNLYISRYRKQQKKGEPINESQLLEEGEDFSLFEQLTSPFIFYAPTPEKDFMKKITADKINQAVESLPEAYKSVVALCCLEDIPYQQAATILDLPIGTVRSRLHRGRALLQKNLWELGKERGYAKR